MVLYKRKPLLPPENTKIDSNTNANTSVWYISETGEAFTKYSDFLNRLSFYNTRYFVSETSGNANSTFFQALQVENMERMLMERSFPDPLKEPILRYVMSMTNSGVGIMRFDSLVDHIYLKFKEDFFPGDLVVVKLMGGLKQSAVIREKVRFNDIQLPNGDIATGKTNYRILLDDFNNDSIISNAVASQFNVHHLSRDISIDDPSLISRERNSFTKAYLKTFLKLSLVRASRYTLPGTPLTDSFITSSSQLQTPWIIKQDVAKQYKIDVNDAWYEPMPPLLERTDGIASLPSSSSSASNGHHSSAGNVSTKVSNKITVLDDTDIFRERRRPMMLPITLPPASNSPTQLMTQLGQTDLDDVDAMFANLKETPPQDEAKHETWLSYWYKTLKGIHAYMELDNNKENEKNRQKISRLLKFAGVKLVSSFDPSKVHLIISVRQFSTKLEYDKDDPLWHAMHNERRAIKVWHYEKCQRFFKSIKISNRRIEQEERKQKMEAMGIPYPSPIILEKSASPFLPQTNQQEHESTQMSGQQQNQQQQPQQQQQQQFLQQQKRPYQQQNRRSHISEDLLLKWDLEKHHPSWTKFDSKMELSLVFDLFLFLITFYKPLTLDTITFDDFEMALRAPAECEMLIEIFCALEKSLMNDSDWEVSFPVELEYKDDQSKEELQSHEVNEEENVDEQNHVNESTHAIKQENGYDDKVKKDDNEDESDESTVEINHNVYNILRKSKWVDFLKKKTFKDDKWLLILLGILTKMDAQEQYSEKINLIFETLAPLDVKNINLSERFWVNFSSELRLECLVILMNLSLTSNTIRSYIDECIEKSSASRKEKMELAKEYKVVVTTLNDLHADIDEAIIKQGLKNSFVPENIKEEVEAQFNKIVERYRNADFTTRSKPNTGVSELEKLLSPNNPQLLTLIKDRETLISKAEELKIQKSSLDIQLNELNCSRVRYLGKDRFFNKYWWFERNGVPNLTGKSSKQSRKRGRGRKDGDEDDDYYTEDEDESRDEASDDDDDILVIDDDNSNSDEDSESDDEKWDNETYLMGKLWIQGPTDSDSQKLDSINGGMLEAKANIEGPNYLKSEQDWAYIDDPTEFSKLLHYLNEKGQRERILKKELGETETSIKTSINNRKKFWLKHSDVHKVEAYLEKLDNNQLHLETPNDKKRKATSDLDEEEEEEKEEKIVIPSTRKRTRSRRVLDVDSTQTASPEPETFTFSNPYDIEETSDDILYGLEDNREKILDRIAFAKEHGLWLSCSKWVNSSAIEKYGHTHFHGSNEVEKKSTKARGRGRAARPKS